MSINNITVDFLNQIDNISLDFDSRIDNILIDFGGGSQNVFSVNGLFGVINLTSKGILGNVSPIDGVYEYIFTHNLNYEAPSVTIYNTENQMILSDIIILDLNRIKILSLLDLNGYKVVVQR